MFDKTEEIPWKDLQQVSKKMIKVYGDFLYYEGEYLDYENVYSVKLYIKKNLSQDIKEKYKVYLIDEDHGWKIIDITPL